MPIKFQCTACGASLTIEDRLAGTSGVCPACLETFIIPRADEVSKEQPSGDSSEDGDSSADAVSAVDADEVADASEPALEEVASDSSDDASTVDPEAVSAAPSDDAEFDPLAVLLEDDPQQAALANLAAAPKQTEPAEGAGEDTDVDPKENTPATKQPTVDTQGRRVIALAPPVSAPRAATERIESEPEDNTPYIEVLQENWKLLAPLAVLSLIVAYVYLWPDFSKVPTYPVRGRVVFQDGTPVKTGKVELTSAQYPVTSAGRINDDGTFVLGTYTNDDGAPAGQHKAIIIQIVIDDGTIIHVKDHGKPVDPKYSRYESSGLSVKIDAKDMNDITLKVTPNKNAPPRKTHTHHHH